MVDETAYRNKLLASDTLSCVFEKALLAACCSCSLVEKHYLAERESLVCTDESARELCLSLHQLLRQNAMFALKHIHESEPFTHAEEMKVQCGGLTGLQLTVDETDSVVDVAGLVETATSKFGSLEKFSYSLIVQSITAYHIRKRHTPKEHVESDTE